MKNFFVFFYVCFFATMSIAANTDKLTLEFFIHAEASARNLEDAHSLLDTSKSDYCYSVGVLSGKTAELAGLLMSQTRNFSIDNETAGEIISQAGRLKSRYVREKCNDAKRLLQQFNFGEDVRALIKALSKAG